MSTKLVDEGKVIATVDIIVVAENKILLIRRMKDSFKDAYAFCGGRVNGSEDVDLLSAAKRELKEETNLSDLQLEHVTTVGNSKRDPRGFCITNVFLAKLDKIPQDVKAGDDASEFNWFDLNNLPAMAFDHKEILDTVRQNHKF